ncbi:MAG: XdhC family protein [Bacteroidales bacterium]
MKNIYLQLSEGDPDISGLALATVTTTAGSTPQKAGSSALFGIKGLISGTIGGGIVEGKVQEKARVAVSSGKPGHYTFRLDNSASDGEDALCGGRISVLLDSNLNVHRKVFNSARMSTEARIPGVLITIVTEPEAERIDIKRYWMTDTLSPELPFQFTTRIGQEAKSVLSGSDPDDFRKIDLKSSADEPDRFALIEPVIPAPRLIIAGAGHIGKALSKIGQMLGFEVTVIDDRPEFANRGNIPDADHIIAADIGESIAATEKDRHTYIVIVTRGHRDDASALKACIGSGAAYTGMIGSKNKVAMMKKEFLSGGWASQEQWDAIYAPVGVDIGSRTVEEIAVSIAAQLVEVKNIKNRK